jgi:hypothetical protein
MGDFFTAAMNSSWQSSGESVMKFHPEHDLRFWDSSIDSFQCYGRQIKWEYDIDSSFDIATCRLQDGQAF